MKTHVVSAETGGKYIEEAVRWLVEGEIVALPTETVYGLAADALNPVACARIFEAKERPLYDPLIVHLPTTDWLASLCTFPLLAQRLIETFWPGPLTLVLPRTPMVPDIVTAGQDTVAVRISAHPVFQKVVQRLERPLAAPSANRFGRISPTRAVHVLSELNGRIPLVVDGGPCLHGIESTIVSLRDGHLFLHRNGPITREELEAFSPVQDSSETRIVPGSLGSHYAPKTPCQFWDGTPPPSGIRAGLLAWRASGEDFAVVVYLSRRRDLREAAARLYASLRRLDEYGVELILVERLPKQGGLWAAIMERLTKATLASRKCFFSYGQTPPLKYPSSGRRS
ncbi:Threonylcarbamoyl-AMP synthase [Candidatus Xiphinematobacter sp. Idaho Grape]|uniref:L-threonylcarbamoyladenylate synthase n=1 Tax=Candidatus Xiphinematobacter sp. Idaho Grape TaxID=1704307 RepID=UPI0007068D52|nr:L-threonylcarbamoyladenylate synthase [Candidatus Xiphinematobacter sp. Idaho Grape]ALJ56911.1 Threonylcarbamoyl-AMP synthase [Candidatus Xiphinematobacter sp. Idaho Grape]